MAVHIRTSGLARVNRQIQRDMDDVSRSAMSHVGKQTVAVLRSPASFRTGGPGEFDTGRQMRGYVFALQGNRVLIGNSVTNRGFSYPALNERRYRVAEKAIRRNKNRIVRFASQDVEAGLRQYRGSYRRASLR